MSITRRMAALVATTLCAAVAVVPHASAAGTVKSAVSLSGPTSGKYGTYVRLTGTAWRYGTATKLSNATIWLQRTVHGQTAWSNVTSTHTSSTGTFAFTVLQRTAYDYRAYYGGSSVYTANASAKVYPAVLQNVLLDSIRTVDWSKGTLQATGRVYPTPPSGTTIWLQRYNESTKSWTSYMSGRTTGSNSVTMRGNVPANVGTYRLYAPLRYPFGAGYSANVRAANYKWRGAFRKSIAGSGGTTDPWHRVYGSADSPNLNELELGAGSGGTSWVDVNTTGCIRTYMYAINYTNEYVRSSEKVGLLNGTTYLRGPYTLAPAGEYETEVAMAGVTRTRVQVNDIGTTDGHPLAYYVVWVLCSN